MQKLNEWLGIEFPFIQGGMANIATAGFAAAVSNAGALGLIGAGGMPPEVFQESIRRCRSLTDKPFGVNIMLMHPQVEQLAAIAAEEKVAVITTGAGDPTRFIPAWKESGAKVIPVVAAVALAKLVAKRGADAVIAEGTESGGHVGEMTTMALVPQVVDAVDIPVIATVVRCDDDAHAKVRAGAKILNIAAGKNTPQVLRELREHYPNLPLIAPGGKTPESIRETIAAGANAIIWTPPSAQQLQADMMQRYRKMKEDATPVISRDDVPIIDQVAAAEVSQVENMNPDVPIPDEVIERVAEHRANRGLKPSLHGFFFRGKKR